MDRILKYKLLIIIVVFFISLINYKSILFVKPHIFVHYPLLSVIISAISLGMIFSVMIYNLAIYLYIKDRQYLFYALAQMSVFCYLISLESLYIAPFDKIYNIQSIRYNSISEVMLLIFSMLFIREFLQTDKIPKLDRLIKVVTILAVADIPIALITTNNVITTLVPAYLLIMLVVSETYRLVKRRDGPFYLFFVGWNIVIITAIFVATGLSGYVNAHFPFLHLAFAIESILLSLALTYKIKLLNDEKKRQQSILLQQSRLSSMGEMIANIAHQWRQPLTHLSFIFMNIKKNKNDPNIIEQKLKEANDKLDYMSKTIDDFRNFYNPSKTKVDFDIKSAIKNALKIANIEAKIEEIAPFSHYGNKNEFEQAILNIINNAREANITITIDKPAIKISDDGGGIDKKIIDKIFEPYFSTKKGSDGIGLYIAKTIIEKEMRGNLRVKVSQGITTFIIEFQ